MKSVEYTWTLHQIARLAKVPYNTVVQDKKRGLLDPDKLDTLVLWVIKRCRDVKLQEQLIDAALGKSLSLKYKKSQPKAAEV